MQKIYDTIRTLDAGGEISTDAAVRLVKSLPASLGKHQLLIRGVKGKITTLATSPHYTSGTFAASFLHSRWWDAPLLVSSAAGVSQFLADNGTDFPDPVVVKINHFVGTIHKFKGNEADNVFLFAQVPFPASKALTSRSGLDEELRTFYVGATRAKHNLYEVEGYLTNANGSQCENISNYV